MAAQGDQEEERIVYVKHSPLYEHARAMVLGLIDEDSEMDLREAWGVDRQGRPELTLKLRVAEEDIGKVIGRKYHDNSQPQTVECLRLLLIAMSKKYRLDARIEFRVLTDPNDEDSWSD